MSSNAYKRNKGKGTLKPQNYEGNPYSQRSLNDPENAYNWENLNSMNRPNEYDLANLHNKDKINEPTPPR